jgi:arylformamidase
MKIYDITQELFSGKVYPGDPSPSYERVLSIDQGAVCNLTSLTMGAHNATHLDAPYHFYNTGKTVEQLELSKCVGPCSVAEFQENCREEEVFKFLETCQKRLLIKGNAVVTLEMAKSFNKYGIMLVGVESQSVGPADAPRSVHLELLGSEVVLLEGLVLHEIDPGEYFLCAVPIKLGGSDGAPCRAILLDFV